MWWPFRYKEEVQIVFLRGIDVEKVKDGAVFVLETHRVLSNGAINLLKTSFSDIIRAQFGAKCTCVVLEDGVRLRGILEPLVDE